MQGGKSGSYGPGYGSGADVAVAYPGERNDDARFLGDGLKFFCKGGHVPLQRVQRPPFITPDFIQQFLVAQDRVVVERQIDQPLFGWPHVQGLAPATGIVGQQVQRDHRVAVFNRYLSRRLGPPDHGTYPGQELPLDDGLDQVSSTPRSRPRMGFSVSPMAVRAKTWASEMLSERRDGFQTRPSIFWSKPEDPEKTTSRA